MIPPGNSAADQYSEGFPTGAGDESANTGRPPKSASPITAPTRQKFESRGASGSAAVELAIESAPFGSGASKGGRFIETNARRKGVAESSGSNDFGENIVGSGGVGEVVSETLGGSNGIGMMLPIILLLVSVLAVFYTSKNFRRSP